MTIDEAMKKIKEKMACDYNISGCDTCDISSCEDRDIIIQLAEWLEDYKYIKQWKSDIMDSFCKYDVSSFEELVNNARNKAIDDFVQKVKEHQYLLSDVINSKDYGMFTVGIEQIAEQLKAGGMNEYNI